MIHRVINKLKSLSIIYAPIVECLPTLLRKGNTSHHIGNYVSPLYAVKEGYIHQ